MAEKKLVMLRYPRSLVDRIDKIVEESGLYLSRSDYVLAAVRSLLNRITEEYSSIFTSSEIKTEKISAYFLSGSMMLARTNQEMKNYTGEKVSVAVLIPINIVRMIEEYAETLLFFRNIQDFIRMAVLTQNDDIGTDIIKENSEIIIRHSIVK